MYHKHKSAASPELFCQWHLLLQYSIWLHYTLSFTECTLSVSRCIWWVQLIHYWPKCLRLCKDWFCVFSAKLLRCSSLDSQKWLVNFNHSFKVFCMYVYLLCQLLKKNAKQVQCLEIEQKYRNKNGSKRAITKALHCFSSQSDHRWWWQGPRRNSAAASQGAEPQFSSNK